MADDHNQRPYRGNEASQRAVPGGASASANDPLAELARLIGQNDPFSEFGRDSSRRPAAAAPRQAEPVPDFTRQPFGSAPLAGDPENYHADSQPPAFSPAYAPAGQQPQVPGYGGPDYEVPGYGAPGYDVSGFPAARAGEQAFEDAFPPQHGAGDDYYDDVPPNRRRIGILAIAGVFALAVIGTAGAFGYRAVFGSSSASPPPVIKAEQAPSKIVPAPSSKDAQSKITERSTGPGERLVSREEQPVVVTTTTPPPAQPSAFAPTPPPQQPALGSGVVGSEPKKIRTIAIKPDATDAAMPAPPESVPAPTAQPRAISTTTQRVAPAQPPAPVPAPAPAPVRLAAPTAPDADPPPPAPVARVTAPVARAEAPANAPLSLNPNAAPAPARAAPAQQPPQRAAAVSPPPAAASSNGVYGVQVTAQRSEEEAQAAYRSLQAKFPGQLGNRQPLIKRVDLGEKGIFFRALVGPFTDSAQANEMCSSLKAAGGSCLIQKN